MARRLKHWLSDRGTYDFPGPVKGGPTPKRTKPALQRRNRTALYPHEVRGRRLSADVLVARRQRARVAKRTRKINRPRRKRSNVVAIAWLMLASVIVGAAGGLTVPRADAAVMGAPLFVSVTWIGGDCWSRFGTQPNPSNPGVLSPFFMPGCHDVAMDDQLVIRGQYFGIDPDIGDAYAVSCLVRNTANGAIVATDYAQHGDGHNATCLGRWTA